MGANGIEIDVHFLHGELLVIHDSTLNRTTTGRGPLLRRTLAQLRALDTGKGEQIPFLHEVIDLIGRQALLNIELKGRRTALPVLALLRSFFARGWSPSDFLISSFHRKELRQLHGSGIPIGILYGRSPRLFRPLARALQASSIHIPLAQASRQTVARIQKAGLKVLVYTVNTLPEMLHLEQINADGFFTDYPDRWTQQKGEGGRDSKKV